MMKQIALALLIFICLCSSSKINKTEESQDKEILIYNTLFDSLYDTQYCPNYPIKPMFKNFNNDTTSIEYKDWVVRYDKWEVEFTKWKDDRTGWLEDFKKVLDTMDLITFVDTNLITLDIEKERDFLLKELNPKDSVFFNLINKSKIKIQSRPFKIASLKQRKIRFLNSQLPFYRDNESFEYGVVGRKYYIGEIRLSRIFFNEKNDKGFFHFDFHGGPTCGYGKYVFVIKINNKWIIYKTIENWIS